MPPVPERGLAIVPPLVATDVSIEERGWTMPREPKLTQHAIDLLKEHAEIAEALEDSELATAIETLLDWHGPAIDESQ